MHPLRAALAGLIDYAGLFPPASLSLARVVANHQQYFNGPRSWLLGRLILPLAALDEAESMLPPAGENTWTISVLARGHADVDAVASSAAAFNDRQLAAAIVAVELAADSTGEIERLSAAVPETYERYIEVPLHGRLPELIDAVAATGCYAKARTGGIEARAFPESEALARFMTVCISRHVPFKATAGLHHPVRGSYRLTYEPQSPAALMHGFVNLVVAAGLLAFDRIDERDAAAVLDAGDASAFLMEEDRMTWGPHRLSVEECKHTRAHVLRSVGSCSFEEPIEDLERIGWLPGR
jgi:hypothetical protein